jgi:hypothetical protein
MIDKNKIYLTKAKYDSYIDQLIFMKTKGEIMIAQLLSSAPSSGMGRPLDSPIHDLARRFFDERDTLSAKMNRVIIIDEYTEHINNKFIVDIGAKVNIESLGEKETYFILGPDEANPDNGIISFLSPLGAVLIGKCVGDTVSIPNSNTQYKIIAINYPILDFPYTSTAWEELINSTMT